MRLLTDREVSTVAGGEVGDIVVTAYRNNYGWFNRLPAGYPGESTYDDGLDYYHKYMYADHPYVQSEHDLGEKLGIDLDEVIESTTNINGHTVKLVYDLSTIQTSDYDIISQALSDLTNSVSQLDSSAKSALSSLDTIVFSGQGSRGFSVESEHTYVADLDSEIRSESSAFAAASMLHDAEHIHLWDTNGHDLNESRGVDAEITCTELEIANQAALGLSDAEVAYLQDYISDPDKIAERLNQDPTPNN